MTKLNVRAKRIDEIRRGGRTLPTIGAGISAMHPTWDAVEAGGDNDLSLWRRLDGRVSPHIFVRELVTVLCDVLAASPSRVAVINHMDAFPFTDFTMGRALTDAPSLKISYPSPGSRSDLITNVTLKHNREAGAASLDIDTHDVMGRPFSRIYWCLRAPANGSKID